MISMKNKDRFDDEINRRLCVAPMMDWTNSHCRYFHRLLAPSALLFTEMVTADAICHSDPHRFLSHNDLEHPLVLQLGGCDPEKLHNATKLAVEYGFSEFNLNVGCPSDRVQSGRFGARLMAEPEIVHDCVSAMKQATDKPVTVKCRIGIDNMDVDIGLDNFVDKIALADVSIFYIHARKAWLNGLSPKENRNIPPLNYERVARLKQERPDLTIIINGGLTKRDEIIGKQNEFDGVMLGRVAYKTPFILAELHAYATGDRVPEKQAIAFAMADYAERVIEDGGNMHQITRHMLGLFTGERGAKYWRRQLGESVRSQPYNTDLLRETAKFCCLQTQREVA